LGSVFRLAALDPRAAEQFVLVTCVDSRIEPLAALGLAPGDCKILRNAGGRVTDDVLRSLAIVVALLGVERIAIVRHTPCSLGGRTDQEVRRRCSPPLLWTSTGLAGGHARRDRGARRRRRGLRRSPMIPEGLAVAGWMYDVQTGAIEPVVEWPPHHR
jgi:carbonic anhydrase